jgi:hypothetical protein
VNLPTVDKLARDVCTAAELDALAAILQHRTLAAAGQHLGLSPQGVAYRRDSAIRKITAAKEATT